jgi:hypothetical protein
MESLAAVAPLLRVRFPGDAIIGQSRGAVAWAGGVR